MAKDLTMPQVFQQQVTNHPSARAFYYCRQRDRKWVEMTWKKYRDEVVALASWLSREGVEKGDRVAIMAANRPEWLISELAILWLGAVAVPIYATASHQDASYILDHSEAKVLLVDHLNRIEALKNAKLHQIIAFDRAPKLLTQSFQSPVRFIAEVRRQKLRTVLAPVEVQADDQAMLIYTSGTTGRPKGAIHTHGNLTAALNVVYEYLKREDGEADRFFSFLPLSHVAEQALIVFGSIATGSEVAFARTMDTLGEDLVRCRPTVLLCVPRLWEKIYEKVNARMITASPLRKALFKVARQLGEISRVDDEVIYKNESKYPPLTLLSDMLVGYPLKSRLGLDRCRLLLTGAAPTRPEIMRFFGAFGLVIREVYGLTENLCLGVLNEPDQSVIGSCGKPFHGNEVKISDDGEILFRAPYNFKGYYKNPEATAEALTADGWLKTGDLGQLDEEGRLWIVGRKKELVKTSGGKYIAPVPIEDSLKSWTAIQDAMVVGDTRKYCVALVSLDEAVIGNKDQSELRQELKAHLRKVNQPLASFETIKRLGVLRNGFTVESGELTPTLKVKRNQVMKQHEAFIDQLYSSEDSIIYETRS
jgi:long-chain acyl-CoA synthetase